MIFAGITITSLEQLCFGLWLTLPLLLSLAAGITLLGYGAGRKEGWSRLDTLYWSFITATTVGYGDLRPAQNASKIASIPMASLGLMLSGIVVAFIIHAVNLALDTRR